MNAAEQNLSDFYQSVTERFRKADERKFWSLIERVNLVENIGECFIWKGARQVSGYGAITIWGKIFKAHRYSYLLNCGPIPNGLLVCHKCDVRRCVNPEHLFLGTHRENMHDMVIKGRSAKGDMTGAAKYPERRAGMRNGSKTHPECVLRGEGIGLSKLTEDQVKEIRQRYGATRESIIKLGAIYGVHFGTIAKILRRHTWKHI